MFSIYGEVAKVSLIMNVLYLIKHFFVFLVVAVVAVAAFLILFFHLPIIYLSLVISLFFIFILFI